jgi:hypothetical protein
MVQTATLVSCADSKRTKRNPSWSLYNSTLFEKSMTAAMLCGDPFIMSAEHGLVPVTERLDYYDTYLGDFSDEEIAAWADDVVESIPDQYDRVILFGGRDYVDPIFERLDCYIIDAYQHTSGNGQQMAVAGNIADNVLDGMCVTEAIYDAW